MASDCDCCTNYVRCCSCFFTKQHQKWSKSLRNFPQFNPITCFLWLEQGGKKNAGEKSYTFFREGYVYDIYACEESDDFFVKARCYRSLRKSEEPHYLSAIFRENDGRGKVYMHHALKFLVGRARRVNSCTNSRPEVILVTVFLQVIKPKLFLFISSF